MLWQTSFFVLFFWYVLVLHSFTRNTSVTTVTYQSTLHKEIQPYSNFRCCSRAWLHVLFCVLVVEMEMEHFFKRFKLQVHAVCVKTQIQTEEKNENLVADYRGVRAWTVRAWSNHVFEADAESHLHSNDNNHCFGMQRVVVISSFSFWALWYRSVATQSALCCEAECWESISRWIRIVNLVWVSFVFPHELHPGPACA